MNRHYLRLIAVLSWVLWLGMSIAAWAQDGIVNARGDWTIYSRNIDNGELVTKHVQISQSGTELWGHFEGPNQSGPIHGFVNRHHIEFDTQTRTVLHFRGRIDENGMSGLYGIRGRHAGWSAVRE
jgi:hypothetical protein